MPASVLRYDILGDQNACISVGEHVQREYSYTYKQGASIEVLRDPLNLKASEFLIFPTRTSRVVMVSNGFYSSDRITVHQFEELKESWLEEVGFHSNPDILYQNHNYQAIIKMGHKVIPYLINDLKEGEGDWFVALMEITHTNPMKKEHYGDYDAMANDWIEWSAKNLGI